MFCFQTQLIPDLTNPERIDQATFAPGLNGRLPIEETGQVVNQLSTGRAENHTSLVHEQEEEFGEIIIVVLEGEVLILTIELTPVIMVELN